MLGPGSMVRNHKNIPSMFNKMLGPHSSDFKVTNFFRLSDERDYFKVEHCVFGKVCERMIHAPSEYPGTKRPAMERAFYEFAEGIARGLRYHCDSDAARLASSEPPGLSAGLKSYLIPFVEWRRMDLNSKRMRVPKEGPDFVPRKNYKKDSLTDNGSVF